MGVGLFNIMVVDCQPLQHEERGIYRYSLNFLQNLINNVSTLKIKIMLIVNNFLEQKFLEKLILNDECQIITLKCQNVENINSHERNVLNINNKTELTYETDLAKLINEINPTYFICLSEFDRRKVMIDIELLDKNIVTFCILYDLIPLMDNWLFNIYPENWSLNYLKQLNNMKKYSMMLAISDSVKNDCINVIPNITTIGTGVTLPRLKLTSSEEKSIIDKFKIIKPYIFCQTSFSLNKGLDILYKQYMLLPNTLRNKFMLIIGSNIPNNFIESHSINDEGVVITGYLSEKELYYLHKNAYLFVFPSTNEGFGLPVVESIKYNKPVIVSNIPSLSDIIKNNDYMFNTDDNSCSILITKLLTDNKFYNKCISHCFLIKDKYSWTKVMKQFTNIVNSVKHVYIEDNSNKLGINFLTNQHDVHVKEMLSNKYFGAEGLSSLFETIRGSIHSIRKDNTSFIYNKSINHTNYLLDIYIPSENETILSKYDINIIYSMFESNKLPEQYKKTVSRYDKCIVPSECMKKMYLSSNINIPIDVIPLPIVKINNTEIIDYIIPKKIFWQKERPFYIGFIGNWKDRKNIDKLIESVYILSRQKYNVKLKLHFAYWYDIKYLNKFEKLYKKYKHIIEYTTGVLNNEEKYQLIKTFDLLVSCSSAEGFSLPPREAIAVRVPVLVTDVMGHKDLIDMDLVNTIYVDKSMTTLSEFHKPFDGRSQAIFVKSIVSGLIHCYNNYNNCVEKARSAYYLNYLNSTNYNFINKLHFYLKYPLYKKHPINNKVVIFFPSCFYPPTDGCHKVILEEIYEMKKRMYNITVISLNNKTGKLSYEWSDNSILFIKNLGVELNIIENDATLIKTFFIKNIINKNYGIIRINYQPEFNNLHLLFDYIRINKNTPLIKKIIIILDAHDDVMLSLMLQSELQKAKRDKVTDMAYWHKYIHKYYNNNLFKTSPYLDTFDIILAISHHEQYIFEKYAPPKTLVLYHNYIQMNSIDINHTNRQKIIFFGGDNIFNIQAMQFLCDKILPLLPSDFEITLYGNISKDFSFNDKRLIRNDYTKNLSDVFTNTLFSICPIIAGTGSKIKILDSIANKIPVVTFKNNITPWAIQNLNCYYVDDEFEFAKTCIKLKNNPELCNISTELHTKKFVDKCYKINNYFYNIIKI